MDMTRKPRIFENSRQIELQIDLSPKLRGRQPIDKKSDKVCYFSCFCQKKSSVWWTWLCGAQSGLAWIHLLRERNLKAPKNQEKMRKTLGPTWLFKSVYLKSKNQPFILCGVKFYFRSSMTHLLPVNLYIVKHLLQHSELRCPHAG